MPCARPWSRSAKGKATADQIVLKRILAELVADIAPARHVELLFERARRLRKAGKPVEAFGSLKPCFARAPTSMPRSTEGAALLPRRPRPRDHRRGRLRTARADAPIFEQLIFDRTDQVEALLLRTTQPSQITLNETPVFFAPTLHASPQNLAEHL